MKLLIAGDVDGKLDELLAKVASIHESKAGPFDALFVCGKLTCSSYGSAEVITRMEGGPAPAVPVYFHDPGPCSVLVGLLEDLEHETEVMEVGSSGLHYLGRGGIKTVMGKLSVGFLGDCGAIQGLERALSVSKMGGYGGADLLLTSDWSRGVDVELPESAYNELSALLGAAPAMVGESAYADMATALRPRYHFSGGRGVFWQRLPYRNLPIDGPDGDRGAHVTRFIGLGKVGAKAGKAGKWLHAISVEPLAFMSRNARQNEPPGTTDNPYTTGSASLSGTKRPLPSGFGSQEERPKNTPLWVQRIEQEGAASGSGSFFWSGGGVSTSKAPTQPTDPSNTTVFVGNLTNGRVTDQDLTRAFGSVGGLVSVKVLSKFGFAQFQRHEDAARAIEAMNGMDLRGNSMRLSWKKSQEGGGHHNGPTGPTLDLGEAAADPGNKTMFVWNVTNVQEEVRGPSYPLFWGVHTNPVLLPPSPQMLRKAIAGICSGNIVDIRTSGAYCFVEFDSHEAAAAAIQAANGMSVGSTSLVCKWSKGGNRSHAQDGESSVRYPADPRTDCWFCLASPQLEEHLIVSIADATYLALPKGGLVPLHALIVPIAHTQSYAALSQSEAAEVEHMKAHLRNLYRDEGCEMLCFERCVTTKGASHVHIQAVPIPTGEEARGARILIKSEARRLGMTLDTIKNDQDLQQALGKGTEQYFYAEVPGASPGDIVRLVHFIPREGKRSIPLQFGRDVAAKLLMMPERVHWKACTLPKEEETRLAESFKGKLQSHKQ
jgi:hypothetical protein